MTDLHDAIPKVELHCHVEGTVRPTTVIELARKAGRSQRMRMSFDEIVEVALDGIEASWLDDAEKRTMRGEFETTLAGQRASDATPA